MPEMSLLLPLVGFLLVIGAIAGVLAGLLGVGGGIVLVPAFFYAFSALGYEGPFLMQMCLATSLATIIVTSIRSVMSHNKKGAVDWGILRTWAPGIVVGAAIGVTIASSLESGVLQLIFGILALVIGCYMLAGRDTWRLGEAMPKGPVVWAMSGSAGLLSVLMGIGGGSFGVPMMTLFGVPIHRAVATAAGFGVTIAVPSVIGFMFLDIPSDQTPPFSIGAVNVFAFVLIVSTTFKTAPYGAKLAHRMNPKPLKRAFGVFLVLVALNMLREVLFG